MAKKKHPPKEVLHDWQRKPPKARPRAGFIHECSACQQWTANLPLYKFDVCPARDRRKGPKDRRA